MREKTSKNMLHNIKRKKRGGEICFLSENLYIFALVFGAFLPCVRPITFIIYIP